LVRYAPFLAKRAAVQSSTILHILAVMNIVAGVTPLVTPALLAHLGHRVTLVGCVLCMAMFELMLGLSSAIEIFVPAVIGVGVCKGILDPTVAATYRLVASDEKARSSLNGTLEACLQQR
jgi:predicted MFS family arabinose efflux permease